MFDWARGSVLKQMIQNDVPLAGYDPWLKKWAYGWTLSLMKIPPSSRVMDVGAGRSAGFPRYLAQQGCEAHVLDVEYDPQTMQEGWGFTGETVEDNPEITFHKGLAGEDRAPAEYFDLVTCISVMEHIYDHDTVVDPVNPYPHLGAIRDMVRMVKPGGYLVMTYDFFLNDLEHHRGWDYLMDIKLLQMSGMPLASGRRALRSRTYLYNHEDTLFMQPEGVLSFSDRYLRLTSVGMVFRKPGAGASVQFAPDRRLTKVLFPHAELAERRSLSPATWDEARFRMFTQMLRREIRGLRAGVHQDPTGRPAEDIPSLRAEDYRVRELAAAILTRIRWRLRGRL